MDQVFTTETPASMSSLLLNSMNRAVMLDMAIRDIEESLLSHNQYRITEEDIEKLPTIVDQHECSICMDNVEAVIKLSCSHTFCKSCLLVWLKLRNACPMCRAVAVLDASSVVKADDVKAGMRLLRQLVYGIMCEDARIALFSPEIE